jgi:transposase-like protein
VAYPKYVREKARKLRLEKRLSIVEIADRLGLPKTTIWYWVRDLPLARPRRANAGQRKGNRAMREKYRRLRDEAYARGRSEFTELASDPTFRDFVCMYIGEGYKRNRNCVALNNSDPAVVKLAARWIRRLANNPVRYTLQHHADQDVPALCEFWAHELEIDSNDLAVQLKSNSNGLSVRTWRSRYGLVAVSTHDTALRARLQAWMDRVQEEWA